MSAAGRVIWDSGRQLYEGWSCGKHFDDSGQESFDTLTFVAPPSRRLSGGHPFDYFAQGRLCPPPGAGCPPRAGRQDAGATGSDTGGCGERGFPFVEDFADLAGQSFQGEGFLQEACGYVNRTVVLEGGFGIAGDEEDLHFRPL
jgi:hypothetical protein